MTAIKKKPEKHEKFKKNNVAFPNFSKPIKTAKTAGRHLIQMLPAHPEQDNHDERRKGKNVSV
ncbi:MAG: hypothetical protein MRJ96_12260 [Nitrospirales bacterium]|nr:hypothetical protein [Nitrospira sp.]MDR4502215.1 hypothetical protein [Nitrospirales bacterium]